MFGQLLNKSRKEAGFTAQQMADCLGVNLSSYRMYESNKRRPSFESLVKITAKLGVSADYLLSPFSDEDLLGYLHQPLNVDHETPPAESSGEH